MEASLTSGPLLHRLREAQQTAEAATSYPAIVGNAEALSELCKELGDVVVWPVDAGAAQLAGAALVVGGGAVRVRRPSDVLRGETVLVLAVAAVSPLPINEAAMIASRIGAGRVVACGVQVVGAEHADVEAFFPLVKRHQAQRRIA